MDRVLIVHYGVGILVAALAALFVWRQMGRRIMLYVLTLQILLGFYLIYAGLKAPSTHYALAIVAWVGFMAANGISRRPGRGNVALVVTALSTVCVLVAFYLGQRAVSGG